MARYRDAKCRLCRREGMKLFLKGARCFTDKCAIERRNYPPGQHGLNRGKLTPFGVQLREKQKAKRIYGVLESQFRKYFQWAESQKGVTGENLLRLLELRLDNVVYRLGFAASRSQGRQLVRHNHFTVNGKKVNIPSYQVSAGDVISLREGSAAKAVVTDATDLTASVAPWLQADHDNLTGTVLRLPDRADIDTPVQEQLIVEFYSK
jgi:small subunit ribosomal protein S4